MEIKQLSEKDFLKEFEENIKDLCIELFHIHKKDLSINDLIEYMKTYLYYIQKVKDNKTTHIELREQIKSITDFVFRNEEVKLLLKKVEKELLLNKDLKKHCLRENIKRRNLQKESLDEYKFIPNDNIIDERNLNKIKNISLQKNLEDEKKEKGIKCKKIKTTIKINDTEIINFEDNDSESENENENENNYNEFVKREYIYNNEGEIIGIKDDRC
jgi:vacuolar-type H+-ATPase catalytic subunit A/Vma1